MNRQTVVGAYCSRQTCVANTAVDAMGAVLRTCMLHSSQQHCQTAQPLDQQQMSPLMMSLLSLNARQRSSCRKPSQSSIYLLG